LPDSVSRSLPVKWDRDKRTLVAQTVKDVIVMTIRIASLSLC
jgi:hypothetical protein